MKSIAHPILALAVLMLLVASCKKDDDGDNNSGNVPAWMLFSQVRLQIFTRLQAPGMTMSITVTVLLKDGKNLAV